ncbi:hypothetical protein VitviT2T_006036 [Vitis vinifera]|uniref:Uncharacterized protein n=1 Tax=Vitis vinifera TaxID=29760 RepID=A0ABY9BUP3_VITVI|nr:hypothetical protein VitviT2T_006036 [Vitis vinifera]
MHGHHLPYPSPQVRSVGWINGSIGAPPLHASLLQRRWHSKIDANPKRHAVVPALAISTTSALIVFVASGAFIGSAWFSDQLQMAPPPKLAAIPPSDR